jgi:hypothetical protein
MPYPWDTKLGITVKHVKAQFLKKKMRLKKENF